MFVVFQENIDCDFEFVTTSPAAMVSLIEKASQQSLVCITIATITLILYLYLTNVYLSYSSVFECLKLEYIQDTCTCIIVMIVYRSKTSVLLSKAILV